MKSMFVQDSGFKHYMYSGNRRYYVQYDPRRECWQFVGASGYDASILKLLGRWHIKELKF